MLSTERVESKRRWYRQAAQERTVQMHVNSAQEIGQSLLCPQWASVSEDTVVGRCF